MSYTLRPRPSGDTLVESRDPIRTNFQILQDRFDENHTNLDAGVGGGKHSFLQLPEQTAPLATALNEAGLYAKVSAVMPNESALFFRGESSGKEYQLTTPNQARQATFGTNPGWTFLPGGLVMQYGTYPVGGMSTGTIPYGFAFPTKTYHISATTQATGANNSRKISINTITTAGFNYMTDTAGGLSNILWMAIGK